MHSYYNIKIVKWFNFNIPQKSGSVPSKMYINVQKQCIIELLEHSNAHDFGCTYSNYLCQLRYLTFGVHRDDHLMIAVSCIEKVSDSAHRFYFFHCLLTNFVVIIFYISVSSRTKSLKCSFIFTYYITLAYISNWTQVSIVVVHSQCTLGFSSVYSTEIRVYKVVHVFELVLNT